MDLYFHINASKRGYVLRRFAASVGELILMDNPDPADGTLNYHATLAHDDADDLDSLAFCEYCLASGSYGGVALYGQPVERYLADGLAEGTLGGPRLRDFEAFAPKERFGAHQYANLLMWLRSHHPAYRAAHLRPHRAKVTEFGQLSEAARLDRRLLDELYESFDARYTRIVQELVLRGDIPVKWVSEETLFQMIHARFPDAVFQYHAPWLSGQSIDIFIPSRNVAIEYQGKQHFEPVEFFGGVRGLEYRTRLDAKKRRACALNDVNLIEWRYDVPVTEENVERILSSNASGFRKKRSEAEDSRWDSSR
jgi:hypothetical protein